MATGSTFQDLCEEVTCPICLDYFRDPVILTECGHNFCRACLAQSWGEAAAGAEASCPVCKQIAQPRNLRPNRQLANVVEIAKKLNLQGGETRKEEARERTCEKHREPLKLFCQTDEIFICTICDRSKEHKNHQVIPAEEAAPEYKNKFFSCLKTLRTEREEILASLASVEDESREMLKRTELTRQQTVAEFRTLHQLLKDHENNLLALIEETEKEVARKKEEHLAKLSEKVSSLEILIREMEEKQVRLLQDVRGTLHRYEKRERFENPKNFLLRIKRMFSKNQRFTEAFPSELKERVHECLYNPFLKSAMKQFRDILTWAFPKLREDVILDQASACSRLILSFNQKSMTWQRTTQDSSQDPEKHYGFVLGSKGFTAGCHFWEVLVESRGAWAVGVANKLVKSRVTFTPSKGIWAVGRWKGQYKAFINGVDSPLALSGEFQRIRVCLNYDGGQVAFFDANTAVLLYEFSGASFGGETLHPFFVVYGDGRLQLIP